MPGTDKIMAGLIPYLLLSSTHWMVLNGSMRILKTVYRPYGHLMCRELCDVTEESFTYNEDLLSCRQVSSTYPRGADERIGGDSLTFTEENKLVSDSTTRTVTTRKNHCNMHRGDLNTLLLRLHRACQEGYLDVVKCILSIRPDAINHRGKFERTLVMNAALRGRLALFEFLVSEGCGLTSVDTDHFSVLHLACEGGNSEIVRQLVVNHKQNVNSIGALNMTPTLMAVKRGQIKVVELLLENGYDQTLVDKYGNNILHEACKLGFINIVRLILKYDVIKIDCKGKKGTTPVMFAATNHHWNIVDFLLSKGCNMSAVNHNGNNILHLACKHCMLGMVKRILRSDAVNIDSKGRGGATASIFATRRGCIEILKILVDKGSDLTATDTEGNNLLHLACRNGRKEIVKYLLTLRSDWKKERNKNGYTPLEVAACAKRSGAVDSLKAWENM